MDGQLDIFDALDQPSPRPPFTVYTCVWGHSQNCGWCGKGGYDGGGARRSPDNGTESWFFSYCANCRKKYGHPNPGAPGLEIIINRTQNPRPAHLGPVLTKEGG